jgi:hypothetical protein
MNKNNLLFAVSLISACLFAVTAALWTYWIALFIGYPLGILSFITWKAARKDGKKRRQLIPAILVIGLLVSLAALILVR